MRQRYLVAVRSGQAHGRGEDKGMTCARSSLQLEIGGHSNQTSLSASVTLWVTQSAIHRDGVITELVCGTSQQNRVLVHLTDIRHYIPFHHICSNQL